MHLIHSCTNTQFIHVPLLHYILLEQPMGSHQSCQLCPSSQPPHARVNLHSTAEHPICSRISTWQHHIPSEHPAAHRTSKELLHA